MMKVFRKIRDVELGEINFYRSRGWRMSIKVHPERGVWVGVPIVCPLASAMEFVESKRAWIKRNLHRQTADKTPIGITEAEKRLPEAKLYLPQRLALLADKFGLRYNRVSVKRLKSKWGSCSSKGNINLSAYLICLPTHLQDYVMLHELSHLEYMNHGPEFHACLERLCTGHFGTSANVPKTRSKFPLSRSMEKELKTFYVV